MENMIMSMTALTSIHAGAGQALNVIDLPIQREGHTQFPVIFGSSLKGALRFRASQVIVENENNGNEKVEDKKNKKLNTIFGPDTKSVEKNTYAGAIMVSDAKLLLLPVRSLNGYFKWVTCPALLNRYLTDCKRAGITIDNLDTSVLENGLNKETAIVIEKATDVLFLEEFALTAKEASNIKEWVKILAQHTVLKEKELNNQLVIINNDMFTYLAQNSTPVNAHVALDEHKTAIGGALWYEETLPPETVMYSLIVCNDSRNSPKMPAKDVADILTKEILPENNRYLQVGGNETVGMGWFEVKFITQ